MRGRRFGFGMAAFASEISGSMSASIGRGVCEHDKGDSSSQVRILGPPSLSGLFVVQSWTARSNVTSLSAGGRSVQIL